MSVASNWLRFDVVLFDLGGLITPTAPIHGHAWSAHAGADLVVGHLGDTIGEPTSEVRT